MIRSFELVSIEAKRYLRGDVPPTEIRIDTNSTVTEIRAIDKRQAFIDFRFTANYYGMGIITMEGTLIWEGDVPLLEKEWKNNHKLPDESVTEIHSVIVNSCIIESVLISKEIRLPPPIPLPVQMQLQKSKPPDGMDYH
ncbi:MAG: hypothetical protein ACP5F1_05325 [Thermoplasmata archaeon]|nr:hypothetical protein [Thermoplasmata archaeon]